MRPLRLELKGFTSFRERVEIDFSDCDLFALVGPTGSGKSSVIDAICFVLYGSVPRYDDNKLVAPAISDNRLEARVRLDFSVNGKDYTAVRVVRRGGKGGATTKEAVLECSGTELARGPKELTAAVTKLLGLSFEHFTRCVVLPQGEFSRFLHDGPSDRQGLIVKLLNLGIYERMRSRARTMGDVAGRERELKQQRLDEDLSGATPEALEQAVARLERLQTLQRTVQDAMPRLSELGATAQRSSEAAREAHAAVENLRSLEVPPEVEALGERLSATAARAAELEASAAAAEEAEDAAEAALSEQEARRGIEQALDAHRRRQELVELEAQRSKNAGAVRTRAQPARIESERAGARLKAAERALEEGRNQHAAQYLAAALKPGAACPVCLQEVSKLPAPAATADLDRASLQLEEARLAERAAAEALLAAEQEVAAAQALVSDAERERRRLDLRLLEERDEGTLHAQLASVEAAERSVDKARTAARHARRAAQTARTELDALQTEERGLRRRFENMRDRVAALEPPPAQGSALVEDWALLQGWAVLRMPELEEQAASFEAAASEATKDQAVLSEDLVRSCRDCELEPAGEPILDMVGSAVGRNFAEVETLKKDIEIAGKLRADVQRLKAEAELSRRLALELSAQPGRFESWIVEEALRRLVEGATGVLNELSATQYSMTLSDKGEFLVIDHHNADETRSAKTLSGGETFLASLALALSLTDQLAELAEQGAARLDAIFLDEGFGTLDEETLQTVAATVENLAATGRMVGIITHVRELAERVPLQFRVRKDQVTSSVQRVPA